MSLRLFIMKIIFWRIKKMKKYLSIALAIVLTLVAVLGLAACSGEKKPVPYEGDLSAVIGTMYEKENGAINAEFKGALVINPIDVTDYWSIFGFLGLGSIEELEAADAATDGNINVPDSGIKEAYFSESSFGMQPYSLVVARVNDIDKVEEIKNEIFNNIDMRKWVCTAAEQLRVASYGDVIMLVMSTPDFANVDSLVQVFAETISNSQVTGGDVLSELTGEVLSKG